MRGTTNAVSAAGGGLEIVETFVYAGTSRELSSPAKLVLIERAGDDCAIFLTPGQEYGDFSLSSDGVRITSSGPLADIFVVSLA